MTQKKKADEKFIAEQVFRLKKLLPYKDFKGEDIRGDDFYEALIERIAENDFKEEILIKTIDHVVDNTEPRWLSIASVMKAKQEIEEYEANRFRLHPALRDGY
jgi:hypothetical protein